MKLVILDRDGVINEDSDAYIKSPEEWHPIPGSAEAIARLNDSGFQVLVATNQSGIGRGYFSLQTLEAIHQKMIQHLEDHGAHLAGIFVCPHKPEDHCDCRKPLPGLLNQIAQQLHCTLENVPLVGDSLRDLETALARRCNPVLVKTGKGLKTLEKGLPFALANTPVFDNLSAFVDFYLHPSNEKL
jgi:D-glycero-D-manno-heptose 1,7-bisphosphate phosphatase